MTQPAPSSHHRKSSDWTLAVVRGARVGQVFPLAEGDLTLGNRSPRAADPAFLGLLDQEGSSPRKMAAEHATLSRSAAGWTIRDLETPGGTFVNNRRVLPGVAQPLAEGDVIQLGSVQLRLTGGQGRAVEPPPRPSSEPSATGFLYQSSVSGTICRNWDDFLTLSAQRWEELRDDLIAGRLTRFVASVGRPDLAPVATSATPTTAQADERLDAWLARLPTRSGAEPELDVHPIRLKVAVATGGVTVRQKIRVANVGHRLLRGRVRVEPGGGVTLVLDPAWSTHDFLVRDFVDVPIEIVVPDPITGSISADLVVSGAGVEKRVTVQVDRKIVATPLEGGGIDPELTPMVLPAFLTAFGAMPPGKRAILGGFGALCARLVVGLVTGSFGEAGMTASGSEVPALGPAVVALGLVGALAVGWLMKSAGGWLDALWGSVAGLGLGTLLAALLVAACRAIEPILGPWGSSPPVVLGLWVAIGVALAILAGRSRAEPAAVTVSEATR